MKYDGCQMCDSVSYPNNNVTVKLKKKKSSRVNLLDVFIVQSVICVAVSCAVLITRFVTALA